MQSNEARYYVRAGAAKSSALKLTRRLLSSIPKLKNGRVTLAGHVTKPLAHPAKTVTISVHSDCTHWTRIATAKLDKSGHFKVAVKMPTDAKVSVFRASTQVPSKAGAKKLSHSFTLPR
jgi:hypothetical protein